MQTGLGGCLRWAKLQMGLACSQRARRHSTAAHSGKHKNSCLWRKVMLGGSVFQGWSEKRAGSRAEHYFVLSGCSGASRTASAVSVKQPRTPLSSCPLTSFAFVTRDPPLSKAALSVQPLLLSGKTILLSAQNVSVHLGPK